MERCGIAHSSNITNQKEGHLGWISKNRILQFILLLGSPDFQTYIKYSVMRIKLKNSQLRGAETRLVAGIIIINDWLKWRTLYTRFWIATIYMSSHWKFLDNVSVCISFKF